MNQFVSYLSDLPGPNKSAELEAVFRQEQLTKPLGSLGRLEEIVRWLAAWQGKHPPTINQPHIIVFAGNHGVTQNAVSAYPTSVTAQMVENFRQGGAAINSLAKAIGASLSVIPIMLEKPTSDLTSAPAMSSKECVDAFELGIASVSEEDDIILLGEMGIGNTTAAAALASSLFGGDPTNWVGSGTGLDDIGLKRKLKTVKAALAFHGDQLRDPFNAMCCVGGRELAAIAGACLEARRRHIPVILDGYVSTVSAAVLWAINRSALEHCYIGHVSVEPGHGRMLGHLGKRPLLDLGMRLGEASGAAVALAIIRLALATHNGMSTFVEAGVDNKSDRNKNQ